MLVNITNSRIQVIDVFADVLESTRIEEPETTSSDSKYASDSGDSGTSSDDDDDKTRYPAHLTLYDPYTHEDGSLPMVQMYKGQLKLRIFNNYGQLAVHS